MDDTTRTDTDAQLLAELSDEAMDVLACLPREPDGAIVAEIAADCYPEMAGGCDRDARRARGKVRVSLREIERAVGLFRRHDRQAKYGGKETYGIRYEMWPQVRRELNAWWWRVHRVG